MSSNGRADYLVFHLADLVRMSFMGATSENSSLRLAGLACLQVSCTSNFNSFFICFRTLLTDSPTFQSLKYKSHMSF
jgi:hypothetical protein